MKFSRGDKDETEEDEVDDEDENEDESDDNENGNGTEESEGNKKDKKHKKHKKKIKRKNSHTTMSPREYSDELYLNDEPDDSYYNDYEDEHESGSLYNTKVLQPYYKLKNFLDSKFDENSLTSLPYKYGISKEQQLESRRQVEKILADQNNIQVNHPYNKPMTQPLRLYRQNVINSFFDKHLLNKILIHKNNQSHSQNHTISNAKFNRFNNSTKLIYENKNKFNVDNKVKFDNINEMISHLKNQKFDNKTQINESDNDFAASLNNVKYTLFDGRKLIYKNGYKQRIKDDSYKPISQQLSSNSSFEDRKIRIKKSHQHKIDDKRTENKRKDDLTDEKDAQDTKKHVFKEKPHFIYDQISDDFDRLTTESNDKHKDEKEDNEVYKTIQVISMDKSIGNYHSGLLGWLKKIG